MVPAIEFARDVVLPVTKQHLAQIFADLFRAQCLDWQAEFDHAKKDEASFQQIAAYCAAHPETPEAFAARFKAWAQ